MKTLYLELKNGASGDMVAAALYAVAGRDRELLSEMQSAAPDGVKIYAKDCLRQGVVGTLFTVESENHGHTHRTLADVFAVIDAFLFPAEVKALAKSVYEIIARAEAEVHGTTEDKVQFHEVGSVRAVANVVCACFLLDAISPSRVVCSPVNVGGGTVRCAHGVLPVPTPATAELLKGIPSFGDGNCELCTTTGAALVAAFADSFGNMPSMTVSATGYGMGGRDLPDRLNCVRAFVGDAETTTEKDDCACEEVAELVCNVDDITGEAVGYACEKLMKEGALDVSTVCAQTKKNRPCFILTCLCRADEAEKFAALLFKHTSTIGVRVSVVRRICLNRETEVVKTPLGEVRVKHSYGMGASKRKAEFDDLARIADATGKSLAEVYDEIKDFVKQS